jgi:hypothetical protein
LWTNHPRIQRHLGLMLRAPSPSGGGHWEPRCRRSGRCDRPGVVVRVAANAGQLERAIGCASLTLKVAGAGLPQQIGHLLRWTMAAPRPRWRWHDRSCRRVVDPHRTARTSDDMVAGRPVLSSVSGSVTEVLGCTFSGVDDRAVKVGQHSLVRLCTYEPPRDPSVQGIQPWRHAWTSLGSAASSATSTLPPP